MIYILEGDIETGKSTALGTWAAGRMDVFGMLSLRDPLGKRYFKNIATTEAFQMEATARDTSVISVGRYCFLLSAFNKANAIIKNAVMHQDAGWLIIDELGKLELNSTGLHPSACLAIEKAKHHSTWHVILVVRSSLLTAIQKKYSIGNAQVFKKETLSDINFDPFRKNKKEIRSVS